MIRVDEVGLDIPRESFQEFVHVDIAEVIVCEKLLHGIRVKLCLPRVRFFQQETGSVETEALEILASRQWKYGGSP